MGKRVLIVSVIALFIAFGGLTCVRAQAPGSARPSNPGGPGEAVGLAGDPASGANLFKAYCAGCHGPEGKGGVPNPGSADGTIPPLNPIDPTIASPDDKVFAANVDLFIEHGSRPTGPDPSRQMPPWGDTKILKSRQIADLIAYIIKLNRNR